MQGFTAEPSFAKNSRVKPHSLGLKPSMLAQPRVLRLMAVSALLVPVPIVAYYIFRGFGFVEGTCEDLVTLLVMLPLGGPHVVATFSRTFFDPAFRRRERAWVIGSLLLWAGVFTTAVLSVGTSVRWLGHVPMSLLLTGFFFWASLHILQQNLFCLEQCAPDRDAAADRRFVWLERCVVLTSLYPMAFFRMAMVAGDGTAASNPHALETRLVESVAGSEVAASYAFRIGRAIPVLPEFMKGPHIWCAAALIFFAAVAWYAREAARRSQEGTLSSARIGFVAISAFVGFVVPFFPNLDSAFQGINAWHCFQYLVMVFALNREAQAAGQPQMGLVAALSKEGAHVRFYLAMVAATIGAMLVMFTVAYLLTMAAPGRFRLFGFDASELPIDPATGAPAYRPGAVLSAYYLLGFGGLLVHYLQDTFVILPRGMGGLASLLGSGSRHRNPAAA